MTCERPPAGPRDGATGVDDRAGLPLSVVAERLRLLERELAEVRTRVNGLLFVVAGAAVTQLVLRVLG